MGKLSDRAKILLWLVNEASEVDWSTGVVSRYFVPQSAAYYYRRNGKLEDTFISGGGDSSALKGLESKGLITRPKTALPNKYVYVITESGLLACEQLEGFESA